MKRYLLLVSGLAAFGLSQELTAKMTREQRLERSEERTSDRAAIVADLKHSGFARKNPRAFALATKSLMSSEKHLQKLRSGRMTTAKRSHHARGGRSMQGRHERHNPVTGRFESTRRGSAARRPMTGRYEQSRTAQAAPAKQSWSQRWLGTKE